MKGEVWKDVPGYEGLYQVSDLGRVRSLDIVKEYNPIEKKSYKKILKGRILKSHVDNQGYKMLSLYKDCEQKHMSVHRLVAITFLEKPDGCNVVGFRDNDRLNLKLENLYWRKRIR